jgi:hypothetical protein
MSEILDIRLLLSEPVITEAFGYLAAGIVFLTFCMRTMLALRIAAIVSNLAFIAYALLAGLLPILILHVALLPLNVLRLVQMRRQVERVAEARAAPAASSGVDWLAAHGNRRRLSPGQTLFRKGERGESMFVVVEGGLRLPEIGIVLGPGALVGEMSLFSADRTRNASAEAAGPTLVAEITEREVRALYFDNPDFAYELMRLITQRMLENQRRIEATRATS